MGWGFPFQSNLKLFCNDIKSGSLRILRSLLVLLTFELLKGR